MAHTIIEQLEYEVLTGFTLDSDTQSRFNMMAEAAVAKLEQLLGWPLDPDAWSNQYLEIGKSRNEFICPDVDSDDLDPPDAVIGKYRIYTAHKGDIYLNIDPAIEVHAIKVIRNGVTCKTYEADEYQVKFDNGEPQIVRYIELSTPVGLFGCNVIDDRMEIAVDATWAYEEVPIYLKSILAELIHQNLDIKGDIKSESVASHSYTKFDRSRSDVVAVYESTLRRYAGPNGMAKRRLT